MEWGDKQRTLYLRLDLLLDLCTGGQGRECACGAGGGSNGKLGAIGRIVSLRGAQAGSGA